MCKKILSVIFAVIIAATCIPFASAAVRGDVDGNGKVNSSDALTVLQYSVGQIKTISKTKADINGDGKINSSDALMILQISVGMITDIKAGFIFLHDENSTYDYNFMEAAEEVCRKMNIEMVKKVNIDESNSCYNAARELIKEGCNFIFADSFGHEDFMIKAAKEYPNVQFVHATGTKANSEKLKNYHNTFASIEQGRYLTGVAAGMKLNEMINQGRFTKNDAKMGFVGSFTYAEVISAYTAFYLGAKSVCPSVKMEVQFTGSWYDETAEKEAAEKLINRGCKIISQHADSLGAPMACEYNGIPNITYSVDTKDWCPNTYLVYSKINWEPILTYYFDSIMTGKSLESDYCGSLAEGSVEIGTVNSKVAAKGTQAKIDSVKKDLINGKIHVFDTSTFTVGGKAVKSYKADIITDWDYMPDTEVISNGYFHESEYRSAPYFDIRIDGIKLLNEKF